MLTLFARFATKRRAVLSFVNYLAPDFSIPNHPKGLNMIKSIAAILTCAAIAAVPLAARVPETPLYRVSMKLFDGTKLSASPSLITKRGEQAQFMTGDQLQYFHLVATSSGPNKFHLNSNLVQWTPTGLMKDGEVLEVATDGKPAVIILGKYDAKSGKLLPMRIEVSISPVNKPG
jgi:hypothetical protein